MRGCGWHKLAVVRVFSRRDAGICEQVAEGTILLLKFEQIEPLGRWFGGRLAETVREGAMLAADAVVPVPNQARPIGGQATSGTSGQPS